MALKSELESKEADCVSTQGFIDLCHEAIKEPADKNYAKYLLEQAETLAQISPDYIAVADAAIAVDDAIWFRKLLAETVVGDHFFWAHMGEISLKMGDEEQSRVYLQKAVDLCGTPEQAVQLANRLFRNGMDKQQVRKIYLQTRLNMQSARDELVWAEKIIVLFRDAEWALQTYDELAPRMTSSDEKKLFNFSRHVRLDFQMKAI